MADAQLTIKVVDDGGTGVGSPAPASSLPPPLPAPGGPTVPPPPPTAGGASAAVEGIGSQVREAAAQIPGAGRAMALLSGKMGALTAGVAAATASFIALNKAVDQAAAFNAEVASATARSSIREEQAAMRRAERLGPGLAEFERTRSDIEIAMMDLWTEILAVLIELFRHLKPFIETIANSLKAIGVLLRLISEAMSFVNDIQGNWSALLGALDAIIKWIKRMFDDEEDGADDPFLEGLLDFPGARDPANAPIGPMGI